jgi:hypothetical protein
MNKTDKLIWNEIRCEGVGGQKGVTRKNINNKLFCKEIMKMHRISASNMVK